MDVFLESSAAVGRSPGGLASSTASAPSMGDKGASSTQLLEFLEVELEGYKSQLKELNAYSEKLTREYNKKVELQEVLEKVG